MSNFSSVDQAKGKNITMWATLNTWESIAFTPNQAKYLTCKLTDDAGVEHKCRIYEGKGALPGQEHLEKRMEFSISTFQGTYKGSPYTGYSGFWSHGAVQDGQQGSQKAAQATKAPQSDIEDVGIRESVVCAYLAGGSRPLIEDVEYWIEFIKTGIDASLPENTNLGQQKSQNNEAPW